MNMLDKEFDQLFNTKLSAFEQEPSVAVWANINRELHGARKGSTRLLPFLSTAASIIIVVSAGMLLMPRPQKIKLHGAPVGSIAKTEPFETSPPIQPVIVPKKMTNGDAAKIASNKRAGKHTLQLNGNENKRAAPNKKTDADSVARGLSLMAGLNTRHQDFDATNNNIVDIQPDNTAPDVQVPASNIKKTNMAAQNRPVQKTAKLGIKKKIRNLGDLLNAVIAQVDKRPNKIIEFNDDDTSFNPIHINLGLIKTKKDN